MSDYLGPLLLNEWRPSSWLAFAACGFWQNLPLAARVLISRRGDAGNVRKWLRPLLAELLAEVLYYPIRCKFGKYDWVRRIANIYPLWMPLCCCYHVIPRGIGEKLIHRMGA